MITFKLEIDGENEAEVLHEMRLVDQWFGMLALAAPIGPVPDCLIGLGKKVRRYLERHDENQNSNC